MRDDFLSADWAAHHHKLSRDIHKVFSTILVGLAWLNAYQFDAPWRHDRRPDGKPIA